MLTAIPKPTVYLLKLNLSQLLQCENFIKTTKQLFKRCKFVLMWYALFAAGSLAPAIFRSEATKTSLYDFLYFLGRKCTVFRTATEHFYRCETENDFYLTMVTQQKFSDQLLLFNANGNLSSIYFYPSQE